MADEALRKIIDEALGPIKEAIDRLASKEHLDNKIKELEDKLFSKVKLQNEEIKTLKKKVADLQNRVDTAETAIDDAEQYSRRMCLRIDGIPLEKRETENICKMKVSEIAKEMGIDLPPEAFQRAHRTGRVYSRNEQDNAEGREGEKSASEVTGSREQQMIVKFKSWEDRVLFYRNRKKLRSKKVKLDLTKRRYGLLKTAKSEARSTSSIDFVFADINCRLTIRTKFGKFQHFNSEEELYQLLDKTFSDDELFSDN